MNKESFSTQIENVKQQILNEKLIVEEEFQKNQSLAEENRKKQEIERQNEKVKRIEETKKFFAGTNIIETLEEVKEKQLLTNYERVFKRNFFSNKPRYKTTFKAKDSFVGIKYDLCSVSVYFDEWNQVQEYDSFKHSKTITITKEDNIFNLKFDGDVDMRMCGFEIISDKATDIVSGIAKVVALKQLRKDTEPHYY